MDPNPIRHGRQTQSHGWPQLADHEHGLAAYPHRCRDRRLGGSVRAWHRRRHVDRSGHPTGTDGPWPGCARYQRVAAEPGETFSHLRPQRAARFRAVRARHRVMGHRRQGRGTATLAPVGGLPHRNHDQLRQPAALRRGPAGRRRLRTCCRPRLPRRETARDHHA